MENSLTIKAWNIICKYKYTIALIFILFIASILRYSGYNWDSLYNLHPDERAISNAVSIINFTTWNLDPDFYAYGSLTIYLIKLISITLSKINPVWNSYDHYILIGRFLSATLGIASVLIVYLIGCKLYNRTVGIVSSLFLALTVSHIQDCHFSTVDIALSTLITFIVYLLIDIYYSRKGYKRYVLVSIFIGLALAVKISAMPILLLFLVCHIVNLKTQNKLTSIKQLLLFASCGLIIILTNFIAQPYAYINHTDFINRVLTELNIAKTGNVCYDLQYIGSPFLLYYIKEIVLRSMGPPLGILSLIGFLIATITTLRKPSNSKHVILLIWALPYFLTLNSYTVKYIRYLEPLFPFLCLFAGYYFVSLIKYLSDNKFKKIIATLIGSIIIGYTLFYALAFSSIYMKPHTFIIGSKWFNENIPDSAYVLSQHWDEGFPLKLRTGKNKEYQEENNYKQLEIYEHFGSETEDRKKVEHYAKYLVKGDYIVAQTRRLYGAVSNVKEKYPVSFKYFDLLFTGRLGFKLIKEFNSYPSLLGIEINDDLSDESFSVYDHPKVLIFKKVKNLNKEDYTKILNNKEAPSLNKNDMLSIHNKPENKYVTYTIIDEILIIFIWWLLFELFSIIGIMFFKYIFKKLNISTIFFSYIIGLLVFSYSVWILSSFSIINYTAPFIITIFLLLLLISILYIKNNFIEIKTYFKENIDTILFCKISFLAVFIIFLLIRSTSPEIYWGEKPMDFGILNNLIRINHLPPDEIWFSGNTLNYYYFGHYIFATLAKLTFIPEYFVYNLSLASIGAIVFIESAGILYLLSQRYIFSLLAGILTIFCGNLSGLREYIYGKNPINFDFFWATSRVIPDTINEYPLWSVLFGDLHAHVSVMPVLILVLYLGVYLYRYLINSDEIPLTVYLFSGLILGIVSVTNSWDFPGATAILFICITVALFAKYSLKEIKSNLFKIANNYLLMILTVISSFIYFIPYWLNNKSTSKMLIDLLNKNEVIRINDYLTIWGLFIFIFITLSATLIYKELRKNLNNRYNTETARKISLFIIIISGLLLSLIYLTSNIILTSVLLFLTITALLISKDTDLKLMLSFIVTGIGITLFTQLFFIIDRTNTIFKFFLEVWYIFAIACSYSLFYLFNEYYLILKETKSKIIKGFSFVWCIILGLLIFLSLFTVYTDIIGFSKNDRAELGEIKPTKTINGLAYLKFKNPEEFDAIQWIKNNIKENAVILEAQIQYNGSYRDFGRIVMNTGIPTVVGWEHHLKQRTIPQEEIIKRYKDVEKIYSSDDINLVYYLLQKYRVAYIYIGKLETKTFNKSGLKKFENNSDKFKLIYSNTGVKIFKVI